MTKPIRVAHLVSHPIQYFAPLYRELTSRRHIKLTVFFYSDATAREFVDEGFGRSVTWDTPLLEGYRYRFMPSASSTSISGGFLRRPNWDIVREIASGRYDVLWVHGYAHLTTWLAVAAARACGMRVLIRDEQTLLHSRPFGRRVLKEAALRALYSQSSALYIGEGNRRYFAHYGMPAQRMWPAHYCVDNEWLQAQHVALRPHQADIRRAFGIDGDAPVVLFAGKLIDKKQPLMLINAFASVRRQQEAWLLIAGDGPLRADAEMLVARQQIPNVRFAGFLNQSELPKAYVAADVFVLPSKLHETWGLVVNEAMNAGLPVIVSDKVGCATDLIHNGQNGIVFPHKSAPRLARAMSTLIADPALCGRYGAESRRIVDTYSIGAAADGIVAACLSRRDESPEAAEGR